MSGCPDVTPGGAARFNVPGGYRGKEAQPYLGWLGMATVIDLHSP